MHPEVENDVCYSLLLELLAYQFASPVRWIETQDVLLSQENIQRLIEIGPANTLAAMTKKTLTSQYNAADAARPRKREVLCHQRDARKIHCEVNPPVTPDPQRSTLNVADKAIEKSKSTEQNAKQAMINDPPPQNAPALEVPDAPVLPGDILNAIVASKLKRPFADVDRSKSIKALTGGRSTLENELVGDISVEFAAVPDRCEDLALSEFGVAIQASGAFSGQLGKVSSGLLARLFSSKMPGGFNQQRTRAFLQTQWGLPTGHQTAVLLRACCNQQATRLSDTDAHAFLDGVVREYSKEVNLKLDRPSPAQAVANQTSQITVVQSAEVDEPSKRLHLLRHKAYHQAQDESNKLRKELDGLTDELGELFIKGIKPVFTDAKSRRFDSYWNWAVQDLLDVFYSVLRGKAHQHDPGIAERCSLIARRSSSRLLHIIKYLKSRSWLDPDLAVEEAKAVLSRVDRMCSEVSSTGLSAFPFLSEISSKKPITHIDSHGKLVFEEVPRLDSETFPSFRLKTRTSAQMWVDDEELSSLYRNLLNEARSSGPSFEDKAVLVTGAGSHSIGGEVVKNLLASGARVIVTTSSYSTATLGAYRDMYTQYGARGSELVVVPFNQGSQKDVESLAAYIYNSNGLGWDIDHIVPFAAISEAGREIDDIDSKSELAHRIMLVNLIRLLGAVKKQKEARQIHCRPAQVVLPLSPNHGSFGGDGLYAESKVALEALFDKWHAEGWAPYLTICGASIGWTRGTGLMAGNDALAAGFEALGVRTFTQAEIAFCVLILMSKPLASECDEQPILADLTGGLSSFPNLKETLRDIRARLNAGRSLQEAISREEADGGAEPNDHATIEAAVLRPQPNLQLPFPTLPDWVAEISSLHPKLEGMVDLDNVVVVTGFAEIGPWGNARTRWDMEANGTLSVEGCIEMAWIMGLITNYDGQIDGQEYHGWVDAKTKKPVHAADMKARYESHILDNSGIRLVPAEPGKGRSFLQEIVVEEDLPPFSVPKEMAEQFRREHGDRVDVYDNDREEEEEVLVQFRKGANLMVPKALGAARKVAGQLPQGWDPRTYGISEDIVSQVDPVTLYTLVTTIEALLASGITDPYELYEYIHISDIGNCLGSGLGGVSSLKKMFLGRHLDKPVQSDILAESFINTTPAWVNMLLLSAAGPIRTSVGACATSIESLETGVETIVSGKAKMCLVGGFDDLSDVVAAEFGNMRATVDAEKEMAKGRWTSEMSRPTSSTRSGFVESEGAGVQIITSARLALDMGLPIYGIVVLASTASDTIGRSVPAPGKGILTTAAEKPSKFPSPLLDIGYRRRRLDLRKREIQRCAELEAGIIEEELAAVSNGPEAEHLLGRRSYVEEEAQRLTKAALNVFGNSFWKHDPHISPMRGALAVWGLTVDDIDIASLHGTSTRLNDLNESQVIQQQMAHLGRHPGNFMLGICQKYLTGHGKGAAGAWMLNGCLQVLNSGLVPGNRNADNIDAQLEACSHLVFPNRTIQTAGVKAFSLTSFGFGQKGAQAVGIHPRYLFAALKREDYEAYRLKVNNRKRKASSFFQTAMATNTLFAAKESAPYAKDKATDIFLNPQARASRNDCDELLYEDDLVDKLM